MKKTNKEVLERKKKKRKIIVMASNSLQRVRQVERWLRDINSHDNITVFSLHRTAVC
jgi:hypothetical protein